MKDIKNLVNLYSKRFEKEGAIFAFQVGSSLREKEFFENSDLDFLVVYNKRVRKNFIVKFEKGVEINIMRRSKEQFLSLLKEGSPVDLVSLKFGKVLFGEDLVRELKMKNYKPTERTIEQWINTASFALSAASSNYSLPTCICCYFKDLHHSARDFSRAIILKKRNELVEGDAMIIDKLAILYPELVEDYNFIIDGRRKYKSFETKYVKTVKIEENELGKYLLAGEKFAEKAYEVVLGLKLPKVNSLISELEMKYRIDHYHGFWLSPERKDLLLSLVLEGDKMLHFIYDLKEQKWKKES